MGFDPVGGTVSGGCQPGMTRLFNYLRQKYSAGSLGCYNPASRTPSGGISLHAEGRAADVQLNANDVGQKARGDALLAWCVVNAEKIGLQEILWRGYIWSYQRRGEGTRFGVQQADHMSHVHVGIDRNAAANWTEAWIGEPVARRMLELKSPHMQGADVQEWQSGLLKLGFNLPKYGADGDFGEETKTATIAAQNAWKITADGIVGPQTWGELDKRLAALTPVPAPVPTPQPAPAPAPVPVPGLTEKQVRAIVDSALDEMEEGVVAEVETALDARIQGLVATAVDAQATLLSQKVMEAAIPGVKQAAHEAANRTIRDQVKPLLDGIDRVTQLAQGIQKAMREFLKAHE